jgi:hypothetical protein
MISMAVMEMAKLTSGPTPIGGYHGRQDRTPMKKCRNSVVSRLMFMRRFLSSWRGIWPPPKADAAIARSFFAGPQIRLASIANILTGSLGKRPKAENGAR